MNLLPTRPQRVGETLDAGFRLYRRAFTRVLPLTASSAVLGGIPSVVAPFSDSVSTALFVGFVVLWMVLFIFVNPMLLGATVALLGSYAGDQPLTLRQALREGLSRMFPMLGSLIMYILIITTASFLLLIPGIILMVSMMFGMYALVLDRKGPIEALSHSHALVWGRWWRTLTLVSVPAAVALTIMMLFQMPFPIFLDDGPAIMVGMEIGNMIGGAVGMPLIHAAMVMCYYELRLRAEGEDLEERISAAAVPA